MLWVERTSLLLTVLMIPVLCIHHEMRLRDISYAYGLDDALTRPLQQTSAHYNDSLLCSQHTQCASQTQIKGKGICILYGDAVVTTNGKIFNGILCPPTHYDLMFREPTEDNDSPLLLAARGNHLITTTKAGTTTTTTTTAASVTAVTTADPHPVTVTNPIMIYSKAEEKELLGLFDSITPKTAYLIKYDSPQHSFCQFDESSSGVLATDLANETEVCYHSGKRRLMLKSEIEVVGSHERCISFYQKVDYGMKSYSIVQNNTALQERASYAWSLLSQEVCPGLSESGSSSLTASFVKPILFAISLCICFLLH